MEVRKKLAVVLLSLIGLAACGEKSPSEASTKPTPVQATPTTARQPPPEPEVAGPTATPSRAPSDTVADESQNIGPAYRAAAERSGLSFDAPPPGYEFLYGEGHESADFFVFGTPDGASTIAIGRSMSPGWDIPTMAEGVSLDGREIWIIRHELETRITEDVPSGARVEVVGKGSFDEATLLEVMRSVRYDAERDPCSTSICG